MKDERKIVYNSYKKICKSGLVIGSWGNVSLRNESSHSIMITPSGIPLKKLSFEKVVKISLDGVPYRSNYKPSVDTNIHLEIYNGFSNVNSVIHTHSEYATIFAQAKMPIPCMGTTHADYFYNEIPVVKDLTEDEIKNDFEKNSGRGIVKFFYENKINPLYMKAALLPSHGPVVWGESVKEAVETAIVLEHVAKLAYRTWILNDVDMDSNLIKKHFFRKHGGESYYGQ